MDRFNDVPRILPLNAASDHSAAISQLRDIFFLTSSRKEFASEEDRERFFKHWTSYYLTDCPEETLLALDGSQRVTGYLTGCRNSQKAISRLQSPSLELFIDQLEAYPAHFHINVHPEYQGQGIGKLLVEAYIQNLTKLNIRGVHIITAADAANVIFYRKSGFTFECARQLKDKTLLFMGRTIF